MLSDLINFNYFALNLYFLVCQVPCVHDFFIVKFEVGAAGVGFSLLHYLNSNLFIAS